MILLLAALLHAGVGVAVAQDMLGPVAGEYLISGELGGNQVAPALDFTTAGGYIVWQDDSLDGEGTSIGGQRINANLSGSLSPFLVNSSPAGNQEKPRIRLLANGGAAIVWQSGSPGRQDVYLRVLRADGTFLGPEIRVNQFTNDFQIDPDVAVLANGTIAVVWDSYGQDGHLRAVMARLYTGDAVAAGDEFQVNQSTHLNQRSVTLAALSNGRFVTAWVSERLLGQDQYGGARFTADIMARWYESDGTPSGNEIRVSSADELCANPSLAADSAGGFTVAWSQSSPENRESGWNVRAASYDAAGQRIGGEQRLNGTEYGDQYAPGLARRGSAMLAVWTSIGQDGSYDGVYGTAVANGGQPLGEELRINTQTFNRQLHPAVQVDAGGRFLVVWSSYSNGGSGFNLHAQRLASAAPLPVMPAPFVNPLSGDSLAVSWTPLAGYDVTHYEVIVDGAAALATTNQSLVVSNLLQGSTHAIRVGYRLTDGRTGDLSAAVTAKTWGRDDNFDGLPDDWQGASWGPDQSVWPLIRADSDGDGATNLAEFLAGTDPMDPADVLRMSIENLGGKVWVKWNTRPGLIYRLQKSEGDSAWAVYGDARFAPDIVDKVRVDQEPMGIFRVVRVR